MGLKKIRILILIGSGLGILTFILDWENIYPLTFILLYTAPIILIIGIIFWLNDYKKKKGKLPSVINTYKKEREKHSGILGIHITMFTLLFRYVLQFWVIGILLMMMMIMTIFIDSIFKNSDAYKTTENYILNDSYIDKLTGGVKYFGIMPSGSISSTDADLYLKIIGVSDEIKVNVKLACKDKWIVEDVDLK